MNITKNYNDIWLPVFIIILFIIALLNKNQLPQFIQFNEFNFLLLFLIIE
jgi:hypothetical protein